MPARLQCHDDLPAIGLYLLLTAEEKSVGGLFAAASQLRKQCSPFREGLKFNYAEIEGRTSEIRRVVRNAYDRKLDLIQNVKQDQYIIPFLAGLCGVVAGGLLLGANPVLVDALKVAITAGAGFSFYWASDKLLKKGLPSSRQCYHDLRQQLVFRPGEVPTVEKTVKQIFGRNLATA